MANFILTLLQAIIIQILGILGIFFLIGFILSKLQEWTQKKYQQKIGWKGILWTAWIGTPIHEFGHVIFAKIFHHKITHISIFKPNKQTGGLGHVDHAYNKLSIYQRIGNFFIGAAPMLFGSLILVLLLYFLVPNGKEVFVPLTAEASSPLLFISLIKQTLINLFSPENLKAWNFWLFLYISFCISAHIAPSQRDRRNMWKGFFWLVFILFLINLIALALGIDITSYILKINQYLGIFIAIFTYTIIISLLHFILSSLILWPFKKRL